MARFGAFLFGLRFPTAAAALLLLFLRTALREAGPSGLNQSSLKQASRATLGAFTKDWWLPVAVDCPWACHCCAAAVSAHCAA